MKMRKLNILISNDDGIDAPGIQALAEVAQEFGDVTVVAPANHQSGMGHAITLGKPLRLIEQVMPNGMKGFAVTGTPADCVKIATGVVLKKQPDLVLSGINHGSNSSVNSIYSGTLGAAREGALEGIPSMGVSLCEFDYSADFEPSKTIMRSILQSFSAYAYPKNQFISINIPYLPIEEIKGIKLTRQAQGKWIENFSERQDPYGKPYFWLTGEYVLEDSGEDADVIAVENGYVSFTPMSCDFTSYGDMDRMKDWQWEI